MDKKKYQMTPCAAAATNRLDDIKYLRKEVEWREKVWQEKSAAYEALLLNLGKLVTIDEALFSETADLRRKIESRLERPRLGDIILCALENELARIREENQVCEHCGGTGKTYKRECAEDEGAYFVCDNCCGSGINNHPNTGV